MDATAGELPPRCGSRPPPESRLLLRRSMTLQDPVPDSLLQHRPFVLYGTHPVKATG
jgi:hypothetical protein